MLFNNRNIFFQGLGNNVDSSCWNLVFILSCIFSPKKKSKRQQFKKKLHPSSLFQCSEGCSHWAFQPFWPFHSDQLSKTASSKLAQKWDFFVSYIFLKCTMQSSESLFESCIRGIPFCFEKVLNISESVIWGTNFRTPFYFQYETWMNKYITWCI